ncbi:MAG: OmpA family protein [Crocinitomicaceae bacterium]
MKKLRLLGILLGCFLLFNSNSIQAQPLAEKQIKKLVKKGRKATRDLEYWKAKSYYDKATSGGSRDPQHWFEAGAVYYDSKVEREKSLEFFDEAINLSFTDTIPELLYYMGDVNHYIGEYEKAIVFYNLFRNEINGKTANGPNISEDVIRKIEICNNGIDLRDKKVMRFAEITNMGDNINTNSSDYSAVLNKDEDIILFCSRRPYSNKKSIDGEYYEDIYYSKKSGDSWSKSKVIDKSSGYINKEINGGKSHEAPISLSSDGETLYIYKENSIWKSKKSKNGEWGIPVKMNKNTNIGKSNHSIFVTADEQEMYIVAAGAKGSIGGRDIYVARANPDGSWGVPTNVGPQINTKYDEDAPFLTSDGKSFYFASKGHNTMGGYDIFKVERNESGNWGDPINVGAPINSNDNDIFYVENAEGSIAYFSSLRPGSYGQLDLYSASFDCQNIPTTNVNGYTIYAETHTPVSGIIKITNKETGEEMGTYTIDPLTGKYNMVLPPDATYLLELVAAQKGFSLERAHTEEFYVPKQCESYNLFQQISISNVKNDDGDVVAQKAKFENALFDIETATKEKFQMDEIATNTSFRDSTAGIKGTIAHNGTVNAADIEVDLLNLDNEIIRITKTDMYGNFAFEKINPKDDYIVVVNEEDALRSYRNAIGNNITETSPIQGFIQSYNNSDEKAKPRTSIYIADDNNEIKSNSMTDNNGYFSLSNDPEDAVQVAEINRNTTMSYNMDIPTEEVLFSAYLVNLDAETSDVVYSEFIDMVDLKDIVKAGDLATNNVSSNDNNSVVDNTVIDNTTANNTLVDNTVIDNTTTNNTVVDNTTTIDNTTTNTNVPNANINNGGTNVTSSDFSNIYFDFDKYFLRDKSKNILENVYNYLKDHPNATLRLDGHTDWIGTEEYNTTLSQVRTLVAYKYLIEKGIAPDRLDNAWFGETKPAVPNTSSSNRQLNRRVEIKLDIPEMSALYIQL